MEIKNAYAENTGSYIYVFYGELDDGKYFLTDITETALILDASADNLDESGWLEWQEEHLVRELTGEEKNQFCRKLLHWMKNATFEERGPIFNSELDEYLAFLDEETF